MCILYNYLFENVLLDRVVSSWNASAEFMWFSPSNILLLSYPTDKVSHLLGQLDRNFFSKHISLSINAWQKSVIALHQESEFSRWFSNYCEGKKLLSTTPFLKIIEFHNFLFRIPLISRYSGKHSRSIFPLTSSRNIFLFTSAVGLSKWSKRKSILICSQQPEKLIEKKIRSWRIYKQVKPVKCWSHKNPW